MHATCLPVRAGLLFLAAAITSFAAKPPEVPADLDPKITLLQPGVKLTLLAEHPDLVTPTGIDVDAKGNLWLVSSHTHFRPDPYPGPEHDEILVFDAQGKNRRVFYNKTDATMDLELGRDGWVYLAERDRILRIKDTDGDGTAEVEENLAVLATEATYPHNGLAGLAWHPEGDLVFSLGENHWDEWTLTGVDGAEVSGTGEGGIFRCSLDGKRLRRIARGFWNPFGVCVRKDGAIFAADNDPGARPPCRLLHVVEGGDYGYQRRYGKAPVHPFVGWNGELRGTLPMMSATGEAPCGIVPLGGGLLVPSWSDNRIDFFPLQAKGASYETKRIELLRGSDTFRPTCIAEGPGGAFYLTDWVYTSYDLHQRGRLWKLEIDPKAATWFAPRKPVRPTSAMNMAQWLRGGDDQIPVPQLLQLAGNDDPFLAQAALLVLSKRAKAFEVGTVVDWPPRDRINALLARRRALPKDEGWVRSALADEDPEVRFEALRWIADEQLVSFAPEVEKMMVRSDLSFRLFEACLATANTLAGNARAGVVDVKMLLARVRDGSSPAALRAYALRLLDPAHKSVTVALLKNLMAVGDEGLTFEAVRSLVAKRSEPEAAELLAKIAATTTCSSRTRAEAVLGLNGISPALRELCGDEDRAVREEVLRAMRGSQVDAALRKRLAQVAERLPESADLVAAVLNPGSVVADLPAADDTAAWQKRIDAVQGKPDLEAGRRLFFHPTLARCATCHRHGGRGNVVGPDLTAVADRANPAWLLESILQPGREVSPQYHPWSLKLADGSSFTGYALRKGGRRGKEFYRAISGEERAILKSEIVGRDQLEVSLMPPGLQAGLTARELRDLLAFLQVRDD